MAALENHCPQASPRGDVGIAPTFSFLSTGFLNRKYGSTCPCQKQTRPDRNTCQGGFCGIRTVLPVPLQPVYFFLRLQPATIAAASAMPAGMMTTGNASPVFGVEEIFVLLLLLEEDEPELLLMTVVVWLPPAAVVVPEPSLPAVVPVPLSPVTVVVSVEAVVVVETDGVCSPLPAVVFFAVVVVASVVVVVSSVVSVVVVSVPTYSSIITMALPSGFAVTTAFSTLQLPSSFRLTPTNSTSVPSSFSWK